MPTWTYTLCLTAALLMPSTTQALAAAATPSTTKALMQQKLTAAHGLLEGLIHEDYAGIAKNAELLGEISRATTWHKSNDAEFLSYAKTFQNSTAFLVEQAKAKNLEGVALGHVRVLLDCMQCHNFVRAGRPH